MKKVLFIDEEKNCGNVYTVELGRAGYKVLEAGDWKTAVRLAQKEQPDCLVVELERLDLHGLGFIRNILAKSPSLPVILTSPDQDAKDDFASWCAPAFVVKTSDIGALKETLEFATEEKKTYLAV